MRLLLALLALLSLAIAQGCLGYCPETDWDKMPDNCKELWIILMAPFCDTEDNCKEVWGALVPHFCDTDIDDEEPGRPENLFKHLTTLELPPERNYDELQGTCSKDDHSYYVSGEYNIIYPNNVVSHFDKEDG